MEGSVLKTAELIGSCRTTLGVIYRKTRKLPLLPLILLVPFFVCGIFADFLYPHDPHLIDLYSTFMPPAWVSGGSWEYLLGTDQMGRDLLSRLIEGARASLLVSLFGVLFSGIIGVGLGMIAGYFGGKIDNIIMRIVDAWMAIPVMFFMLMLVAVARQAGVHGLLPIIISIALTMWVPYTRVIRGETLTIKQRDYVAMARVSGCSGNRILMRHILPNVMNTIIVMSTMQLGGAIMAEAGMSFLGVGVQPPNTAWGALISESIKYMDVAWWIPTFAGLAITLTILGANLFGDWLRDALDPKMRRS